jgi:hypothetical protein
MVARHNRRNIYVSCFALSSLLPLLAHAGSTPKQDTVWKRYVNAQWGYCVSYPSRWVRGDAFEGSGILVKTGVKKHSRPTGEIDIGVLPDPAEGPGRTTPVTLVGDFQAHLDGLKKFERAQQMEVLEQRGMNLVGSSALFTKDRYYDPLERGSWVDEIVLAHRNHVMYRIELECRADQLGRFEPVFTHLVSTFEFDCTRP